MQLHQARQYIRGTYALLNAWYVMCSLDCDTKCICGYRVACKSWTYPVTQLIALNKSVAHTFYGMSDHRVLLFFCTFPEMG